MPVAIAVATALAVTSNATASIPKGAAARPTRTPAGVGISGAVAGSATGPTLNLPAPPAQGTVDTDMRPAPPSFPVPRERLRTSPNWSGYINVAAPDVYFNDVIGYWRVPRFSCRNRQLTHGSHASQWIGIDGFESRTVEQEGDTVDCIVNHGTVTRATTMWFEMYPLRPRAYEDVVRPGDLIGAETKYIGNAAFQLFIKDLTNGRYLDTVQTCTHGCDLSSTEAINEIPGKGVRAHFGLTKTRPFAFAGYYNQVFDAGADADLYGYFGRNPYWTTVGVRIGDPLIRHHPVMATVGPLYAGGRDFDVYWKRAF
jgi:peptidase A4-like protein